MKLAVFGTRGIPNHYGGFEQLAERLSVALAARGHEVYVYQSSLHPYCEDLYRGVHLVRCYDPEDKIGTAGQFIYDLACMRDLRQRNVDVVLQLGYTSSSVWSALFPEHVKVVTNMDGLEWKRSKYSKPVQFFLKQAERWAVQASDALIADSTVIRIYLKDRYARDSAFIAYGADAFREPDEQVPASLGLKNKNYCLAIARFEPENHLEQVIKGYLLADVQQPLVLVGGTQNSFGRYLTSTYTDPRIRFTGALYDTTKLNSLRYYAGLYFHGHSVGGTNPSLLEAMASQAMICAHDNPFNRAVLGDDALYFKQEEDIAVHLAQPVNEVLRAAMITRNLEKIENQYTWTQVIDAYEALLLNTLEA